jgi:hypothetical protein
MYGELPAPLVNVLAFIQTEAAPVLFQIHPVSCPSFHVCQKRATVENKIPARPVLTIGSFRSGEVLNDLDPKD